MERSQPLVTRFYRGASGREPVREWLQALTKPEAFRIGVDLEGPIGVAHRNAACSSSGHGLHEVRSHLPGGMARVLFIVDENELILLHGFIKKTQKTPVEALALAEKRKRDYEQGKKR